MNPFESREFRAYFLNIAAQAEDSDHGMFADIADAVPNDCRASVLSHAEDEARHARMLERCVTRNGGTPEPVSDPGLDYFGALLSAAGLRDPASDLMRFFVLLQLAEERAIQQYTWAATLMDGIDSETSETLRAIAREERGHAVHCAKLAERLRGSVEEHSQAREALKQTESSVFADFAREVFAGSPITRMAV
jgi:rubrerythrin